jgi:hypothetical protein
MGVRSGVGRHFGQGQASKGSTDQDTRFRAGIRNEPETLLTNFWRTTLAREFPASQISKAPFAKLRTLKSSAFDRLRAGGFVDWRLDV